MSKAKALFLDRDGTINIDNHYVHRKEDFYFIDGIFDLCRMAQKTGYLIIVITNQSGIERGYYTEEDFLTLTDWMVKRFREEGIEIADVFYCPSLSGEDRKPRPGLFEKAIKKFDIDRKLSLSLGDKERDIEAALNAGIGRNYLFEQKIETKLPSCANIQGDLTTNDLTLKDPALKDLALKDLALKEQTLKDPALKEQALNDCAETNFKVGISSETGSQIKKSPEPESADRTITRANKVITNLKDLEILL